jgi:hypothetical protein
MRRASLRETPTPASDSADVQRRSVGGLDRPASGGSCSAHVRPTDRGRVRPDARPWPPSARRSFMRTAQPSVCSTDASPRRAATGGCTELPCPHDAVHTMPAAVAGIINAGNAMSAAERAGTGGGRIVLRRIARRRRRAPRTVAV